MDKIDRLFDAIEHPDRYSDEEINSMLADSEVREVYTLLDKTKSSLTRIAAPNVDAEWDAFKNTRLNARKHTRFRLINMFSRNVAASIAIGLASLAAGAAVVGVCVNYALNYKGKTTPQTEITRTETVATVSADTIKAVDDTPVVPPATIIFDNEPLETIANRIAEYYGCNAEFSADAPKALRLYYRWNQAQTLDEVIEGLNNFERIHITAKGQTIKID